MCAEDLMIECWECNRMREPVTKSGLCKDCAEKIKRRIDMYSPCYCGDRMSEVPGHVNGWSCGRDGCERKVDE